MAGGSHTNFNVGSFSVGAVGGAMMLAGALASGIANLRAVRENAYATWTADALRHALRLSELFRARELAHLKKAIETITDRDRTIAELTCQLRIEQARNRRRRP